MPWFVPGYHTRSASWVELGVQPADWALIALALVGHLAFFVAFLNQTMAMALPWWVIRLLEQIAKFGGVLPPVALVWWRLGVLPAGTSFGQMLALLPWPLAAYLGLCLAVGVLTLPVLAWRLVRPRRTPAHNVGRLDLREVDRIVDRPLVRGWWPRMLTSLPGNEALSIESNEKVLVVPRLPGALDGLVVAHLSDLHLEGKLDRAFFEHAIELVNQQQPDIIAVTGDIVERPECLDWLPRTLGRLRARHGVYFILGNHDLRWNGLDRIRAALIDCGLIDVGGRALWIAADGHPLLVAGNQLPWIHPAPTAPPASTNGRPRPFRMLLAHSPDQFPWAVRERYDLVLAGHTHGGQVQLPGLGAIFAHCHHGTRYVAGLYQREDSVLHVSRGLSGLTPLRWNCRPEVTRLVLRTMPSAVLPQRELVAEVDAP